MEVELLLSGVNRAGTVPALNLRTRKYITLSDMSVWEKTKVFIESHWQWRWTTILGPVAAWWWARGRNRQRTGDGRAWPPDID